MKPKLQQHALSHLLPVRSRVSVQQGLTPRETEGRRCSAATLSGTGTSVSHELRGAALAFTGCVIFLQAFHNVNSELFFAKNWDWGGSRNLSHAQTLISPSESSQLFSTTVAQTYAMKGQQKDSRQDRV